MVIYREIFNNFIFVRNNLERDIDLDIFINKDDNFKESKKYDIIQVDDKEYFWNKWTSKFLWSQLWEDSNPKYRCSNFQIYYFDNFKEAYDFYKDENSKLNKYY